MKGEKPNPRVPQLTKKGPLMNCLICDDKRRYRLEDICSHPGWCLGRPEAAAEVNVAARAVVEAREDDRALAATRA